MGACPRADSDEPRIESLLARSLIPSGLLLPPLEPSSPSHCSLLCVAMAAMTLAGGDDAGEDGGSGGDLPHSGVDGSAGGIDGTGAYSTSEDSRNDDDFAEPTLSTEQRLRLAHIWMANPSTAH
ncbi:hypothetical protein D1007_03435 [Hordeum vulgare]|nr:hypothetical protein D1007_03435 [Hordeum vulgare]